MCAHIWGGKKTHELNRCAPESRFPSTHTALPAHMWAQVYWATHTHMCADIWEGNGPHELDGCAPELPQFVLAQRPLSPAAHHRFSQFCVHTYMCIYIYIYIHMHTCTLTYVCIYVSCGILQIRGGEDTGRRRPIGCLIFTGHFPQKSPAISGSFSKNDLHLYVVLATLYEAVNYLYVLISLIRIND